METLWFSLLALAAGPLLHFLFVRTDSLRAALDGFVVVAIGGIVLIHILPETLALAGWPAIAAALLGLFGPLLFERSIARAAKQAHTVAYGLAVVGLVLHGLVDGAALTGELSHHQHHADAMALGVILHRIPVGLMAWWLIRPRLGAPAATGFLTIIALATVGGFMGGESLASTLASTGSGIFQALVAGSLLHVVGHRTHIQPIETRSWHLPGGLGALVGVALLFSIGDSEPHAAEAENIHGLGETFLDLAYTSAPALILAYFMAGLVQTFLPKASVNWMARGTTLSQAVKGVGFGLPLPICSCGVVPVYRSLVIQGVPPAAALAFLVATPELGLDAIILSVPLLGGRMATIRVIAAVLVAILTAWITAKLVRKHASRTGETGGPDMTSFDRPGGSRLVNALKTGTVEVFDSTAPWIIFGLTIAALVEPVFGGGILDGLPPGLEVPLFALLGMPVYVCASGATPLVAMLIMQGVSPGAALAFLLTGPATNISTFGLLARLHSRRLAIFFAGTVIISTVTLGYVVNLLVPSVDALHVPEHGHGETGWIQRYSLYVLGILTVASILRQGPRGFVGQVFSWTRHGDDDACHEDHDSSTSHDDTHSHESCH